MTKSASFSALELIPAMVDFLAAPRAGLAFLFADMLTSVVWCVGEGQPEKIGNPNRRERRMPIKRWSKRPGAFACRAPDAASPRQRRTAGSQAISPDPQPDQPRPASQPTDPVFFFNLRSQRCVEYTSGRRHSQTRIRGASGRYKARAIDCNGTGSGMGSG